MRKDNTLASTKKSKPFSIEIVTEKEFFVLQQEINTDCNVTINDKEKIMKTDKNSKQSNRLKIEISAGNEFFDLLARN